MKKSCPDLFWEYGRRKSSCGRAVWKVPESGQKKKKMTTFNERDSSSVSGEASLWEHLKKNRSFCSTTRKNFGMDAVSWRGRVHCDHRKLKLGRFLTLPTRRYTVPWGKRCVGTRGYVGIGKRGRIEGSGVNWKHVRRPWHGARKNGVETNKGRERDSNINENNNELNNAEGFDLLVREAVGVPWNEGMAAGGRKGKTPTGVVACCIALSFIQ